MILLMKRKGEGGLYNKLVRNQSLHNNDTQNQGHKVDTVGEEGEWLFKE